MIDQSLNSFVQSAGASDAKPVNVLLSATVADAKLVKLTIDEPVTRD